METWSEDTWPESEKFRRKLKGRKPRAGEALPNDIMLFIGRVLYEILERLDEMEEELYGGSEDDDDSPGDEDH